MWFLIVETRDYDTYDPRDSIGHKTFLKTKDEINKIKECLGDSNTVLACGPVSGDTYVKRD